MKKVSLIICGLLASSVSAKPVTQMQNIVGKQKKVATATVTTAQLFAQIAALKAKAQPLIGSNQKDASACNVPTPPKQPELAAQNNPNAVPVALKGEVAFYPDPNVTNLKVAPAQKIGQKFLAASPRLNPVQVGTPPDTSGIVSQKQFFVAINNGIVSFDKETGKRDFVLDVDTNSFGNTTPNFQLANDSFDPRIRRDPFENRIYILYGLINSTTDEPLPADGGFYLAVSDTDIITPCTTWKLLFIPNATEILDENGCTGDKGLFFDFPGLGYDKHALYVSANMYYTDAQGSGGLASNTVFVIQKSSLFNSDSPVINVFRNVFGYGVQTENTLTEAPTVSCIDNFDDSEFGYFAANFPLIYGSLALFRVVDPASDTPSLVGPIFIDTPIAATAFLQPQSGAPNKGNIYGRAGTIESIDQRLQQPTYIRNHQLYTINGSIVDKNGICHYDAVNQIVLGDRIGQRWHQIDLTGDSSGKGSGIETATSVPALVQAGTLYDDSDTTTPLYYIYGSMMSNEQGDLVIGGTLTGENQYPSAFFVGRKADDPLGVLRVGSSVTDIIFAEGSGHYTRSLNSRGAQNGVFIGHQRWGDYAQTSLDPDGSAIWTLQEAAQDGLENLYAIKLLAPEKQK